MLERRKKYNTPFELKGIVQVEEYSDLLLKLSIIRELKQLNTTCLYVHQKSSYCGKAGIVNTLPGILIFFSINSI